MNGRDRAKEMIERMKLKYQEDFSLDTICDGQAGSPYTTILARCTACPEGEIIARAVEKEKGEWILQDNYLSFWMMQSVRKEMETLLEKVYGACKVYNKPASMVLPETDTKEMGLAEFLSRRESLVTIYSYLPPRAGIDKKEEKAEELRMLFSQKGYQLKGLICYTAREDFYQRISASSYRGAYMERKEISALGIFLMEKEKEYSYLRWR